MKNLLLAALAAVGIVAAVAPADAQNINAQTGSTYTFLNTDCSKLRSPNTPASVQPSGGNSSPSCVISLAISARVRTNLWPA